MATLEERIAKLEHEVSVLKASKLKLSGLKIGNRFELAGLKWIILNITPEGCYCLAEVVEEHRVFDPVSNNWLDSRLREWLNTVFLDKLEAEIGKENIIEFERDLLTLDGQAGYGKCYDKVSLLNIDEYRKYRQLIPNVDKWWWLITAWDTRHYDNAIVVNVTDYGSIDKVTCFGDSTIRPFCVFSSELFE